MIEVIERPHIYEVKFPYNQEIVEAIKSGINYQDRSFQPTTKSWTVSKKNKAELDVLIAKFGGRYTQAGPENSEIPDLPELTIEIPGLKRDLFAFQKKGVAYILEKKCVIVGDEPGLGKTFQSIAAIVAANAFPCLIVCPSTLKHNWVKEWFENVGIKALILTDRNKDSWPKFFQAGMHKVFITNYESQKKYFVRKVEKTAAGKISLKTITFNSNILYFESVIFDEIHRCKDSKTQQSKFALGIAKGKRYVLGLTGTPVVNKPKDLASQLNIIQRLGDVGGNYKMFVERYCGHDGEGASNLNELRLRLANTCFYQRHKKDVLKDLPDKMRQIIKCDIDTREEYYAALDDLAAYLKEYKDKTDEEVQKSMNGEIMVRIGILKNISARGKLKEVFEYTDEIVEAGEKVVLFVHQKEIARKILSCYPDAVSVRGDDSMDARTANIDKFQNDPNCNIIVCSIKAAGVGITLTASSRVGFVELPWHAADCDQCEDRTHRIGQKNSVQCAYFLGQNTIDEWIYQLIESKRSVANSITGADDNVQREIIDKIKNLFSSAGNLDQLKEGAEE